MKRQRFRPLSIISIHAHEHIHARMHTRESALRGRKENATPKGDSLSTLSSLFPKEKKGVVGFVCVCVCVCVCVWEGGLGGTSDPRDREANYV